MALLYNLAKMTTATTGTGTITLGSAAAGFLTFAQAGVQNGDVVSYGIVDGANSEVGTGTYTSSGTTLTRTVTNSTNSNAAINLSGSAVVFITARAGDILNPTATGNQTLSGKLTTVASASGGAGFNLPQGTAPTSPSNGDVWTTTTGLYARINGATLGPFAGGWTQIGSDVATTSGTTVTVSSIPSTYSMLLFQFVGVTNDASAQALQFQASLDNGSTWSTARAIGSSIASTDAGYGSLVFMFHGSGATATHSGIANVATNGESAGSSTSTSVLRTGTAINSVRFLWASGANFAAGTLRVFGR